MVHIMVQGKNALLESPTGTGKTLCLLCATLAWQESMKAKRVRSMLTPGCCAIQYNAWYAQVVTEATPWEGGIVALSNFGFGGELHVLAFFAGMS